MLFCDDYEHPDENLIYILESIPTKETQHLFNEQFNICCNCDQVCEKNKCECITRNGTILQELINEQINKNNILKPIYECNDKCKCYNVNCGNKIVQLGPLNCLKICDFGLKGFGVKTTKNIAKGTFICEYAGEVITKEESVKRHEINEREKKMNYIFLVREFFGDTKSETVVDPAHFGNVGRYLNHSCEPNCQVMTVRVNNLVPKLCIFAKNDILENAELTFDYGEKFLGESLDEKVTRKLCLCGAVGCKQYLPFQY